MSLHALAQLTGYIFVLIGILGFVPGITDKGLLVGIFAVDGTHNLFHLATGISALLMVRKDQKFTRYFFQIIGLVYLAVALLGFAH